nr:ribonuclease H-like domain-containing protein [Tanacetum cinerariifolium]
MHDEYNALVKNGTLILVPRPAGINLVRSIRLVKHKFHADGTLSHYKARLVANGSSQQLGIDCDETFSPVVKPATIRTVLSLAVSRMWPIHQLDKSLYGLKQAPRFSDLQVMPLVLDFTTAVVTLPYSFFVRDLSATRLSLVPVLAEYRGVANVVAETAWLRNLLRELDSLLSAATLVYCDNVSATYLSANPVQHQRTKHIETDIHFVRDLVTAGQVRVLLVPSHYQAINEDERLARAINGLCDGLTMAIEEREKYILPPSQHRW